MSYSAKEIWFYNPVRSTPQIRQAIENFWKFWLPEHSTDDDLQLYHYTTIEGLKGIIKNRSIWLTHTSTLNDPTELKYGKEIILKTLNDEISKGYEETINRFLHSIKIQVNSFDEIMYEAYVACFCRSDNLLSQWRAYGHRGGGYNLGLTFTSDTKFYHTPDISEKESHVILRKIIYDYNKQQKFVTEYVSSIISYARDALKYFENHGGIPEAWESIASMEAANILCDLMLSFKNPVFREENEWRLILVRQSQYKAEQLQFRENEKGLIPYFETYIINSKEGNPLFPLHSIKFGPMLDESSTKAALTLFIRKKAALESNIKIDANAIQISGAGYSLRD
jgi:hypothetical protein